MTIIPLANVDVRAVQSETMFPFAAGIAANNHFSDLLGTELVEITQDRVVVRLRYKEELGVGRIHGGAISGLVDITATACFWAHPDVNERSRGATVGFTINFLKLVADVDLLATATIRRRGGTLCTGDVVVTDPDGNEIAVAIVTYKLSN